MSRAARRFIEALGVPMRGGTLRFQAQYLRHLHLPDYDWIPKAVCGGLRETFRRADRPSADAWAEEVFGL